MLHLRPHGRVPRRLRRQALLRMRWRMLLWWWRVLGLWWDQPRVRVCWWRSERWVLMQVVWRLLVRMLVLVLRVRWW